MSQCYKKHDLLMCAYPQEPVQGMITTSKQIKLGKGGVIKYSGTNSRQTGQSGFLRC